MTGKWKKQQGFSKFIIQRNAMISAIILAAGLSTRMGDKNKLLLDFQGKAIIQNTIESVLASEVMEVIVVNGHQKEKIQHLVDENNYPVTLVENPNYKAGMTSSIQTGIKSASKFADGYMICMGDMPLIETAHYNSIILAFRKAFIKDQMSIAIPYFDQRRGNPVIFSAKYKDVILGHDKPEGCREIIDENSERVIEVSLTTQIRTLDVDKNEDYLALA